MTRVLAFLGIFLVLCIVPSVFAFTRSDGFSTNGDWCDGADFTRNGMVDDNDAGILVLEYGKTGCSTINDWCSLADITRDGRVDDNDAVIYTLAPKTGCVGISPARSEGAPSGTLPSGTTEATLSLNTDEHANCRYSTALDIPYDSMANPFSATDSKTHSTTVTGLSGGNTYTYYVRCKDIFYVLYPDSKTQPNANADDYIISFSISCTPGEKRCDGSRLETCNPDGMSWTLEVCPYGCSSGACNPPSGGGSAPGFEPSLLAIALASLIAALFLPKLR